MNRSTRRSSVAQLRAGSQQVASIRRAALGWYDEHRRDLPWRHNPTRYRVWISEVMLQQTQVATVVPYYQRFMRRFPDVVALAAAAEADVLRLWEGLGYYRRARQLLLAARQIVEQHAGRCPETIDDWRALPGIGRYTAGAILSIADDQPLPILEGNTVRLHCRLLALRGNPRAPATERRLWDFAASLVPDRRAGDLNQALMEIGSQVCLPRQPKCGDCPLRANCRAFDRKLTAAIPVAKTQTTTTVRHAVVVVRRNDRVLVRQFGPSERWAGLWDFPRFEVMSEGSPRRIEARLRRQTGLEVVLRPHKFTLRHAVTRFRIELACYETRLIRGRLSANKAWRWVKLSALAELPLNVTARRIANRIREVTGKLDHEPR
jgi:A/G-specific adenine glycosylase